MLLQRFLVALTFSTSVCYAGTVTIDFTGLPGVIQNNTYNGFSTATINGVPSQLLICDDFSHETLMPSQNLIYDFSTLAGPTPLQYARFENIAGSPTSGEFRLYEEAAVLLWQLSMAGPGASANTVTDYQYAIWGLFTPSTPLFRANQTTLQQDAYKIVTGQVTAPVWLSSAYSELTIYTPTGPFASNQEFLGMTTSQTLSLQPVPEPSMAWVLGFAGGMFLIVTRVRRRPA